jgi:hypothetical protein
MVTCCCRREISGRIPGFYRNRRQTHRRCYLGSALTLASCERVRWQIALARCSDLPPNKSPITSSLIAIGRYADVMLAFVWPAAARKRCNSGVRRSSADSYGLHDNNRHVVFQR